MTLQVGRSTSITSSASDNQEQQQLRQQQQQDDELLDAVRDSLKHAESLPEDEEHYVSADGVVVVAQVDDKSRVHKYRRLLSEREREIKQAAEYGIGLLDRNEELQLQLAARKIQHEADVQALEVECATVKRHHEHALLEIDSWKRRFARTQEENNALVSDFEHFAAQCSCRSDVFGSGGTTSVNGSSSNGTSASDYVGELTHKVAELELSLQQLHASEQTSAATIAQLRAWKRDAEVQHRETSALERIEAECERSAAEKLVAENAKLLAHVESARAEAAQLQAFVDAQADELRRKKQKSQQLLDELADLRLECSAKTELLLTAEARSTRLQRELALLDGVSYLSQAVIDHDVDDSDSDDSDDSDDDSDVCKHRPRALTKSSSTSALAPPQRRRSSLMRADSLMPSPFTAFPSSVRAANGKPVTVSSSDLASHKKLHHYFHLTAQSIIHENALHDQCFDSSSRFTIDSWYREVIALDIPYLEWHAWLITRISHVASAVARADSNRSRTTNTTTPESTRRLGTSGFFLRRDADRSPVALSTASSAASSSSPPSSRAHHVPFAAARTFFRLLRRRPERARDLESSSEE